MELHDAEQQTLPNSSLSHGPGAIDEALVTTFLIDRFGDDVQDVSIVDRQGEWSRAYLFRHAGSDYVIRFSALEDDFARDYVAARYDSSELPIPRVTEIGEAFGGFYAISERAFGGYLDQLDEGQMRAMLPSLFAALDAARRVDLSPTTGYGNWNGECVAPFASWRAALLDVANDPPGSRGYGWRERLVSSPTGAGPFDEALDHMRGLLDYCPEERHLIHSDLLNYNVLVGEDGISAVIDWGCSMYGDFLYDIAWFSFWSPWYPAWEGIDFRQEAARHYESIGLDVPNFDERLRCYEIRIGLGGQAYQAFTGRWADVEATAKRTLAIAKARS